MKKTLRDIGEFGLIKHLMEKFPPTKPVQVGIGDDTAVINYDRNYYGLFTTDLLAEDVHFRLGEISPENLGRKALAVNISDIAAMGGLPKWAVVSVAFTAALSWNFVQRFYQGLGRLARAFKIDLVGGDTSRAKKIFISVALWGQVEKKCLTLRRGTRVGDFIFVTGSLGGSSLGKHFSFRPRLKEARFLVENFRLHALIDISDGLIQDLNHLLEYERLGAKIYLDKIPLSPAAYRLARFKSKDPIKLALTEGEDYELIFTLSRQEAQRLISAKKRRKLAPFSFIGEVTPRGRRIVYYCHGNKKEKFNSNLRGFRHF